ncbi:regulator of nonsense transcripts UPF2, partial [Tanacetum coccineum]
MGGFGQLPIVEGLELIKEPKKKPIKKRKKKLLLDDEEANRGVYGSLKRDAKIEEFKSKPVKACLDDFSHRNIDVACNLLETCGRYLYRYPDTNVRMENVLEILMCLKNIKKLDPQHSTLVENAYYLCKPPERSTRFPKVCPPLHQVLFVVRICVRILYDITVCFTPHVITVSRIPSSSSLLCSSCCCCNQKEEEEEEMPSETTGASSQDLHLLPHPNQ